MNSYYFCAYLHTFDIECEVVKVGKGVNSLREAAQSWMKNNQRDRVYVYDMNYNFVWDYITEK